MDGHKIIADIGSIEKKTEKAILVRVVNGDGVYRNVWFPRSQLTIERGWIHAKEWIVEAKSREIGGIITTDPAMAV